MLQPPRLTPPNGLIIPRLTPRCKTKKHYLQILLPGHRLRRPFLSYYRKRLCSIQQNSQRSAGAGSRVEKPVLGPQRQTREVLVRGCSECGIQPEPRRHWPVPSRSLGKRSAIQTDKHYRICYIRFYLNTAQPNRGSSRPWHPHGLALHRYGEDEAFDSWDCTEPTVGQAEPTFSKCVFRGAPARKSPAIFHLMTCRTCQTPID